MKNKLYDAFDKIKMEDKLKEKTATFLREEIQKRSQARKPFRTRLAIACISFALFLLAGGFSYNLYFTPGAYVDIDVNPSLELTLNCFNRVIEAIPYNDEGALILQDVDIRYKTYDDAAYELLEAMIDLGYLKQEGLVSVTVQAGDGNIEKSLLDVLQVTVTNSLSSHHSNASMDIFAVSEEVKEYAHGQEMSPAKYLAITQLQEVDPSATFESCGEHSISEIKQIIGEHRDMHHGESSEGLSETIGEQEQSEDENGGNEANNCKGDDSDNGSAPSDSPAGNRHDGADGHAGSGHH